MIYELVPFLSSKIWGGETLGKIFNSNQKNIGEAWIMGSLQKCECPIVGMNSSLKKMFEENKDIVAKNYCGDFPLLIKLIDARDDLSIQVHPNAKTESWHILNSVPSNLYLGFKENVSKDKVKSILENGDVTSLLNHPKISHGDTFLIRPGTIHAIGAGTFLIEIQQSADVTYRLYDFNRTDNSGNKRELHIDKALDVINFKSFDPKPIEVKNPIVECEFFHVYKHKIDGKKTFNINTFSFNSITCLCGSGKIYDKDKTIYLKPYSTVFIPAFDNEYTIEGEGIEIILVTL